MIKNNYFKIFSLALSIIILQTSCFTKKNIKEDYIYFRNGENGVATEQKETVIKKNDLLSIQVFSNTLNQEQAAVFNMAVTKESAGVGGDGESQGASSGQGYEVGPDGNIEMPVIGSIKAEGLTKLQLKESLINKLSNYIKLPNVNIRFLRFNVDVLGEVKAPGIKNFQGDKVTIISALSAAGDLTDFGNRSNILVIREQNKAKVYYRVDLRDKRLFESPAYILQQNDIIYVEPNSNKLKTLSVDPDAQRRTNTILTATGIVFSVITLVVTLLNSSN
ncbi:polysaccharide biosynthesis/export family protein [Pedobacter sp. P351]|uniref:polysaccharide biosynthesis/export family protein n=1 Tax=Pedobacter superstes TaxID=3133441 RepID=UPI00309A7F0E